MKYNFREYFCIDTSVFITMHRYYPKWMIPDLWIYLEDLFKDKKIISHKIVYDEIVPKKQNKDKLANWIKIFKPNFISPSQRQFDLIPDILKKFPKLIDAQSEKEQADPWLIAMLIEIMENDGMFGDQSDYIMVTTESERSTIKLPAACKHYMIRHMNLFEFFKFNTFEFIVKKSNEKTN